ncbi:MAG: Crp/Fnr family transcriptional regulator [Bacteroidia bacterium]|jgi:CRP/FNR family transcriptional regulator|nr:Crp/Fnr family transcriptional regulator [Bacteroidia bacterium]
MFINIDLIIAYGGIQKKYRKGDLIFSEGDQCRYYFQIVEGSVKMFNINSEGREFTQGIFASGESFGEPPLFINLPYPASSEATSNTTVIRLPKENFLTLLDEYPKLKNKILQLLSHRVYNKSVVTKMIINSSPETRVLSFLDYYKLKYGILGNKNLISLTRQQIADHIGLRVETVIRVLLRLKAKGKVEIRNRKLYY